MITRCSSASIVSLLMELAYFFSLIVTEDFKQSSWDFLLLYRNILESNCLHRVQIRDFSVRFLK